MALMTDIPWIFAQCTTAYLLNLFHDALDVPHNDHDLVHDDRDDDDDPICHRELPARCTPLVRRAKRPAGRSHAHATRSRSRHVSSLVCA